MGKAALISKVTSNRHPINKNHWEHRICSGLHPSFHHASKSSCISHLLEPLEHKSLPTGRPQEDIGLPLSPNQQEGPGGCQDKVGETAQSKTGMILSWVSPAQAGRDGRQASLGTDLLACPWGWSWPAGHGTTGGHLPPCSASCCSWSSNGDEASSCRSQSHCPGTSWHSSPCCHAQSWGRSQGPHHHWQNWNNTPSILEYPDVHSKERSNYSVVVVTLSLEPRFPHLYNGDTLQGGCAHYWMLHCYVAWKEILTITFHRKSKIPKVCRGTILIFPFEVLAIQCRCLTLAFGSSKPLPLWPKHVYTQHFLTSSWVKVKQDSKGKRW